MLVKFTKEVTVPSLGRFNVGDFSCVDDETGKQFVERGIAEEQVKKQSNEEEKSSQKSKK